MNTDKRHRLPAEIISYTVWLYFRFNLSHRDLEDLLAQRGIVVSYETIRLWCIKFGAKFAKRLKRKHQGYGDTCFIDEVFVKINGKQHYLWRAVDQDGDVVDVFLRSRRDGGTATLTPRICKYRLMNTYKRHRFPSTIISYAVWTYYRFNLSHRDVEDLLAERGITVSHKSIRCWCIKFGRTYARRLKRNHQGYGDTFYIDEVFVKISDKQHYHWRAVDQDGEVVDVFLQSRRDARTAKRFFKRLLRSHGGEPGKIVTDKLQSYSVAHRDLIRETLHDNSQYANNRAELSHQPTGVRERGMRKFKSVKHGQRFLSAHAAVYNLFNLGRHMVAAENHRNLRKSAFAEWSRAAA